MTSDEVIKERNATHGDFEENARISQGLKQVMMGSVGWIELNNVQAEALEMIALKISRILSGNPDEPDHWKDIGGYARLAEVNGSKPITRIKGEFSLKPGALNYVDPFNPVTYGNIPDDAI